MTTMGRASRARPDRRAVLAGLFAAPFVPRPAPAQDGGDRTAEIQAGIDDSAATGRPFEIPAGRYRVGALRLPDRAHLVGRPGRSVLVFEDGATLAAGRAGRITLEGLTIDGRGRPLGEGGALLVAEDVADLRIDDCAFVGSGGDGVRLARCGGRIERSLLATAARAGLFSIDATGLAIVGNGVEACADNGILVWRSEKGDDGAIVSGNRISDIGAASGGTGQYGNGIGVFRAGGVIASQNLIRRCRFSALRNNGGPNVQFVANNCRDFGESAIWHEFAFDGGIVADNIVENAMIGVIVTNYGSDRGRLAAVTGNIVRGLVRKAHIGDGVVGGGVGVKVEGEVVVDGNLVERADWCAVQLGYGEALADAICSDNVLRGGEIGVGVSVAPGAGEAVIAGNVIAGATRAIVGLAWDRPVTGDLAREGAAAYPRLSIAGNKVV
jgi:uncharacterized secreted repeat protein (TIGR03808 family)